MKAANPYRPSIQLLVKLGSLIVHYEEMIDSGGHHFDAAAAESLREDPEVKAWVQSMHNLALLPVKRKRKVRV